MDGIGHGRAVLAGASLAVVALVAVIAIVLTSHHAGAASAAGPRSCAAAASRTVLQDGQARVYALGPGPSRGPEASGRLFGCLRRSGRTIGLGTLGGRERAVREALSGHMVAIARQLMGVDTVSSTVEVVDLASGHTLHQEAASGPVLAPESVVIVDALVLDDRGNLAWLSSQASIVRHSVRYEVHRVNRFSAAQLDAGPSIAPGSLSRHGESVTWRHGAVRRAARLD
jgi:hypothetical protein